MCSFIYLKLLAIVMIPNIFVLKYILFLVIPVIGHGRLMDPPNRSSLWRVSRFADKHPPVNYDDNQLNCGGFGVSD